MSDLRKECEKILRPYPLEKISSCAEGGKKWVTFEKIWKFFIPTRSSKNFLPLQEKGVKNERLEKKIWKILRPYPFEIFSSCPWEWGQKLLTCKKILPSTF